MTKPIGEEILKEIAEAGRRVLPLHKFMAENDPAGLHAYNQFVTSAIYQNDALNEGTKELLLACVCIAMGSSQAVIANHCRRAVDAGVTRHALLQAVEITSCVAATRVMSHGVSSLMEALPHE